MMEETNQSRLLESDAQQPDQSILDQLLVAMRITASAGAVVIIVLGVILGVRLFSLIYGIVQEPTPIITTWQQVMEDGRVTALPPTVPAEGEVPTSLPDAAGPAPVVPSLEDTSQAAETGRDDHGRQQMRAMAADTPPFIVLADHIMERLETGSYSWLIGVGVLMVFCWFLIKIPGMFITAGTRLLLGLVNVSTEK